MTTIHLEAGLPPRLLLVLAIATPAGALARGEAEAEPDGSGAVVAEALFLPDALPAVSSDLNLAVTVAKGEPDPATGERALLAAPTLQLAAPLGDRLGFALDAVIPSGAARLEGANLSLRFLLREAAAATTGFSAALDLHGSLVREVPTQAALVLGALRPIGPVALRASALLATRLSGWTPRLVGGLSAAVAISDRWRALAEVVADRRGHGTVVLAGPTLKVALGESAALMAGALFGLGAEARAPVVNLQLTRSL